MSGEELEELSKAELIEMILVQAERLGKLQADYEALKLKFEKNRKPPTTSKNSSQPPSKDQKGNVPKGRHKRRHGPPLGHEKHERKFVAQADEVVEVRPRSCWTCQTDLSLEDGRLLKVNQITELPEASAQVIEVRQYEVVCPDCQQTQVESPPAGLEMERAFGARLEATVVYYRQQQHMSYVRTQAALSNLHRVEMSQGGIDKIMQRAASRAVEEARPLEQDIQQSAVIHSDETGSRVEGNNWWHWVFCSVTAVVHLIRFDRSVDVVKGVMGGDIAEVWVSDCYLPQMKAPSKQHQLCLAHQLRNLQAVVERSARDLWARHVQMLFRYAIHLHNQRQDLAPGTFANRVERIERCLDRLLDQNPDPPDACRLQRRYRKYRDALFVFLQRTDVPPTNNLSERYLRPSVIHRKVTGGFRSPWGARGYAALKSLIDTAALSGTAPFAVIQSLFGPPALPLQV